MKRVYLIAAAVALLCGGIIFYIFKAQNDANNAAIYEAQQIANEKAQTTASIVIATRKIQKGEVISSEMLTSIDVDRAILVSIDALTDEYMAIGRKAARTIEEGEAVTDASLYSLSGNSAILSRNIPYGMVAVQIPASVDNAVAELIEQGDFVDVLVSMKQEETVNSDSNKAQQEQQLEWIVLAQALEVLHIGDRLYTEQQSDSSTPNYYDYIVVAADEATAIKISNAISNNDVKLLLNSSAEE